MYENITERFLCFLPPSIRFTNDRRS